MNLKKGGVFFNGLCRGNAQSLLEENRGTFLLIAGRVDVTATPRGRARCKVNPTTGACMETMYRAVSKKRTRKSPCSTNCQFPPSLPFIAGFSAHDSLHRCVVSLRCLRYFMSMIQVDTQVHDRTNQTIFAVLNDHAIRTEVHGEYDICYSDSQQLIEIKCFEK